MHADLKHPSRGYGGLKTMTTRDKIFSDVNNSHFKRRGFIENFVTPTSRD